MATQTDLDPDIQFPSYCVPCKYIDEKDIASFLNRNSLSFLHVNCRSFRANFDKLCNLIATTTYNPSIIAVTETWLSPATEELYGLPDYNFFSKSRTARVGGGVGFFVKNGLKVKPCLDLQCTMSFECIFVELCQSNAPNIICGCIYRPPDQDVALFNTHICDLLSIITARYKKKIIMLMGDFNINLLISDLCPDSSDFLNTMNTFSLSPVISLPTRVTNTSSTLLDNFFVSVPYCRGSSAAIYSDISDHYPIVLNLDATTGAVKHKIAAKGKKRIYDEEHIQLFCNALALEDWSTVYSLLSQNVDLDLPYDSFTNTFEQLFNKYFPYRPIVSHTKRSPRKEWLTVGLAKCCYKKNKLFKKHKLNNS